jgi:hypothetical protein
MDKPRIVALGFSDQEKGQLVAALLQMAPLDRAEVFNDVDVVVKATLKLLLPKEGPFISIECSRID